MTEVDTSRNILFCMYVMHTYIKCMKCIHFPLFPNQGKYLYCIIIIKLYNINLFEKFYMLFCKKSLHFFMCIKLYHIMWMYDFVLFCCLHFWKIHSLNRCNVYQLSKV